MKKVCDQMGSRLVMAPIVFNQHADLNDSLRNYASERKIDFIDLKELMLVRENFLPNDLHFSPEGHRNLAELLNNWLKQNPIKTEEETKPLDL